MLHFISDVQLDNQNPGPDAIAAVLADQLAGCPVFDAGDLAEHSSPLEYERYAEYFPLSMPVPGNHDRTGWPYEVLEQDTIMDGVHIIGFNSDDSTITDKMLDLKARLVDTIPTILFMHQMMYSGNTRVGASAAVNRTRFIPILNPGVPLVISGHGHAYERHVADGRTYIVLGTGGAPLDQVNACPTLVKSVSAHGHLDISRSCNSLSCVFCDVAGRARDSFTIYPNKSDHLAKYQV